MKLASKIGAFFIVVWPFTATLRASTNTASANRMLLIGSSSMPVSAGKATLTVGALRRVDGVYTGAYTVKVSPYFWKNEKGTVAIVVSDEAMAAINRGKAVSIVGTATTGGRHGKRRHIDATATPVDINCGTLRLWFLVGDATMIFEPTYHFAEKMTAALPTSIINTNLLSLSL